MKKTIYALLFTALLAAGCYLLYEAWVSRRIASEYLEAAEVLKRFELGSDEFEAAGKIVSEYGEATRRFEDTLSDEVKARISAGTDSAAITREVGFIAPLMNKKTWCNEADFQDFSEKVGLDFLAKYNPSINIYLVSREDQNRPLYLERLLAWLEENKCTTGDCRKALTVYNFLSRRGEPGNADAKRNMEKARSDLEAKGLDPKTLDATMIKVAQAKPKCAATIDVAYFLLLAKAYTKNRAKEIFNEIKVKNIRAVDADELAAQITPDQVNPDNALADGWSGRFEFRNRGGFMTLVSLGEDMQRSEDDLIFESNQAEDAP